ncbi:MAG: TasA family protein [Patescibacteria group bacterium]|nr:TasA family protein [Patescibacteria group bacterium]
MKKLFRSKINRRIFKSIKRIGMVVFILIFSTGMMRMGGTNAFYYDEELSESNVIALGTLDMEVLAENNELQKPEDAGNMLPEDMVTRTATVTNVGTLPFQYNIAFQEVSCSDDLCDNLLLTALKNETEAYEGPLDDFDLDILSPLVSGNSDEWQFLIELPAETNGDLENLDCNFDLVFIAWQTDFTTPAKGWIDEEFVDNNNIHTGDWFVDLGDVVINEIMWMGSTEDKKDEWIELRNMTDCDIEIGKWRIENAKKKGNTYKIPANNTIPANGYFLIANFPEPSANTALSVDPDVHSAGLSLDNDDNGNLVLTTAKKDGKVVIDEALGKNEWPAGINKRGNDPLRQSMERNDEPDDGLKENSWHTCEDEGCTSTDYWDFEGDNYGTPGDDNLSDETAKAQEEIKPKEKVASSTTVAPTYTNKENNEDEEAPAEDEEPETKQEDSTGDVKREDDDDEEPNDDQGDEEDEGEEDAVDEELNSQEPDKTARVVHFDSAHA